MRARVLCVFTCLRAHVLCMLPCLGTWRACVLMCLRAYVLSMPACLRAWWACIRACLVVTMKCFIFLRVFSVLFCLICFTFQYLNLKNLGAKKLCPLLSWTCFLFTFWYQLIKLYETNLTVAGKSIDISYSYSCSKAISIFYNLYIDLIHKFLFNSLLWFDLLSINLLNALTFQYHNIPW